MTGERKSLATRKDELRKKFEECFDTKLEEQLSSEGLATFWSDDTPFEGALEMLDFAALLILMASLDKVKAKAIVVEVSESDDDDEDVNSDEYQVYNEVKKEFYSHKFESKEDADEFVVREACNSEYKLSDFKVVKVCE